MQLKDEKRLGEQAAKAYDSFILPFIEFQRKSFYDDFRRTDPDDTNRLRELRYLTLVIDSLDTQILEYINTGKLATLQLNERENAGN